MTRYQSFWLCQSSQRKGKLTLYFQTKSIFTFFRRSKLSASFFEFKVNVSISGDFMYSVPLLRKSNSSSSSTNILCEGIKALVKRIHIMRNLLAFSEISYGNANFRVIQPFRIVVAVSFVIQQHIIAFQIIMRHIMRMQQRNRLQNISENRHVRRQVITPIAFLFDTPIFQRRWVFLHHNDVVMVSYSVVVHISNARVESEALQTGDFRENIM